MSKKNRSLQPIVERNPFVKLDKQLIFLRQNLKKIYQDDHAYFNEKQNQLDIINYYSFVYDRDISRIELYYKFHHLLDKTHKNKNPYFISKDLYLYTWVDLYPDGMVKCIYSGGSREPSSLILHDYKLIAQNRDAFKQSIENSELTDVEFLKQLKSFERRLKLNTEHIVPKSWFNGLEPMKGDLHHLFVCDPDCNIARSNFPYGDISRKRAELPTDNLHPQCGIAINERFEPRFGRGATARAMLYFLVRYPRTIKKVYRNAIDISILINWHRNEQVTLYEKHRNQAIFQIQGNRNPFIDFPELTERIEFPV